MIRGHLGLKDEVFVDFGGKSQGIAVFSQFENEPKVGDEMEFNVERYDREEGLLILTRKGAGSDHAPPPTEKLRRRRDMGCIITAPVGRSQSARHDCYRADTETTWRRAGIWPELQASRSRW